MGKNNRGFASTLGPSSTPRWLSSRTDRCHGSGTLPRLVEQVLADAEPRIVVNDRGEQVVVMPLDEFISWKETHYLLSSPANASLLGRSIAEAESGQPKERELTLA